MPQSLRIIVLAIAFLASLFLLYPRLDAARLPGNHQGYAPEQPIPYSHRVHAGILEIPCLYCHSAAENGRRAGIPPANVCMNCHSTVAASMGQKFAAKEDIQIKVDAAKKALEAAEAEDSGVGLAEIERLKAAAAAAQGELEKFNPNSELSASIALLYDAVGFDHGTMKPDPTKARKPIRWKRVHRLPDFVYFDHRSHVGAGVDCQQCHGPVQTMERVRQFSTLWMGWCVNCHRDARQNGIKGRPANPSLDCSVCHY